MAEVALPGRKAWWLLAALLPVAAGLTWLSATSPVGRVAVLVWSVAGVAWAVAVAGEGPEAEQRPALALAVLLSSVLLLAAPPRFSDDLWRYLFDGRVGAMGLNPFSYAPANPKVSWVAPELVARMNFPEMRTIYPPVAQGLFALVGWVGGGDRLWRLLLLLVSWGAAWLLAGSAPEESERARRCWGIAASPLVMVSAGSLGALDVTGLVVAVALLSTKVRERASLQGFWVGVGAGLKLFPAILFWTTPASRRLRSGVVAGAAAAVVLSAAYLPIAGIGGKALGSLTTYSTRWSFNGGPVRWTASALDAAMATAGVGASVEVPLPAAMRDAGRRVVDGKPTWKLFLGRDEVARSLATVVGLFGLAWVLWRGRRRVREDAALMALCLLAFYATQFTVYPWYGLWLVPAAVLLRGRGWLGGAALAWVGCLPLALLTPAAVIDGGAWREPWWVTPLLWFTVVAAGRATRNRV